MTADNDRALTDSVEELNDTAKSLVALGRLVEKNQRLLVANQEATEDNTDAISLRSTKEELLEEVNRLAKERKKDRTRTKFTIGVTFFLSLLLIGAIGITTKRQNEASIDSANTAASVCHERGEQALATRKFYEARADQVRRDPKITDAYRIEQLALFADLLEHFRPVDCTVLNRTATILNGNASFLHNVALNSQ